MRLILPVLFLIVISTTQASNNFSTYNSSSNVIENTHSLLTDEEQAFLRKHPIIVLGSEKEWEPYVIPKTNGEITGYDADVLDRINQITGANFTLQLGDWREMQSLARQRKIDGLSTGGIHNERKTYLNFTDIYISLNKYLLVVRGNPANINNKNDLKGKRIIVHRGNLVDKKLSQQFPASQILYADTVKDMLRAVILGDADAAFGNAATEYIAAKSGLAYLEHAFNLDSELELAFGIRKDWPEAVSIINKALKKIGEVELNKLKQKWFIIPSSIDLKKPITSELTSTQKDYLDHKGTIKLCIDKSWPPLESHVNGVYSGMIADIHQLINERLNLDTKIISTKDWAESLDYARQRKCDILSGAASTASRQKYMDFTKPMFSFPMVVAALSRYSYIGDFDKIKGRVFSIIEGYAAIELLKEKYPDIKIIQVASLEDGIELVKKGDAFGYIDISASIGYYTLNSGDNEIKVVAQLDTDYQLSIATRNDQPLLNSIYATGLQMVTPSDHEGIVNHWLFSNESDQHDGISLRSFYSILLFFVVATTLVIVWFKYREAMNERERKSLMSHYSRHSAMGEMVGNIAHQWRQPLSELSSKVMFLDTKSRMQQPVSDAELIEFVKDTQMIMDHMSETIETFMGFYTSSQKKQRFNLKDAIERTLLIVSGSFGKESITIRTELESIEYLGNYGNFTQIILILLHNAKNASKTRQTDKLIKIALRSESGFVELQVSDNFGGIQIDLNKIFENNVSSSKDQAGIGLYIAHKLVSESLSGAINARNNKDGAVFSIRFPLKKASLPCT